MCIFLSSLSIEPLEPSSLHKKKINDMLKNTNLNLLTFAKNYTIENKLYILWQCEEPAQDAELESTVQSQCHSSEWKR